ncbi:co-chaperone DjlA [Marinomonas agarivorans]|nr:co-chaperone DjlA [Marinomonas agarivorans]
MWKIIGGISGFYILGIWGLIVGMIVGAVIDVSRSSLKMRISREPVGKQQQIFFQTLFLLMGRLAKADGRVSDEEIQLASQVMDKMQLTGEVKRQAIDLFNQGKAASFDLVDVLQTFQQVVGTGTLLSRTLIELLLMLAYADGDFVVEEKTLTSQICAHLGMSVSEFEKIHWQIKQQAQFHQHRNSSNSHLSEQELLQAAYDVIGGNPSMSDAEIKKVYRKLMSENHPDKLMAQGVPEEMIVLAKERTQEIQASYDLIKKTRKKNH